MADVIKKSTNRFTKGLIMDFSPENTQKEVLTHALNATLLTFNGNELSLQNDMGNARVETAYLPEGYIPVGTCEYGGIIYIVSYNPIEDKSQIGCFPSPERNVSNKELGISNVLISKDNFQELDDVGNITGTIKNNTQYVLLKNDNLNPGDKFLICSDDSIYNEKLSDMWINTGSGFTLIDNPIIALNIVSIEDSGKIVYLNSDVQKYSTTIGETEYRYHILGKMNSTEGQESVDPDVYRNVLSSGYSVFKSKTSGKLAILAELIMIDSYSVSHSIYPSRDSDNNIIEGSFDIVIHTDVEPSITVDNYRTVPKLQYYYLKNSQGYLQATVKDEPVQKKLFTINENNAQVNNDFLNTKLSDIYTPTTDDPINLNGSLRESSSFDFPKPFTYHVKMQSTSDEGDLENCYIKFYGNKSHRINKTQILDNLSELFKQGAEFYYYNPQSTSYIKLDKGVKPDALTTYYIKISKLDYFDAERSENYKNEVLYKQSEQALPASEEIIKDVSIQKYEGKPIEKYDPISEEAAKEFLQSGKVYTQQGDNEFIKVDNIVSGKTYFIKSVYTVYEPLGYDITDKDIVGVVCYFKDVDSFTEANSDDLTKYWDDKTYPITDKFPWGSDVVLYYRKKVDVYKQVTSEQLNNYESYELYYKPAYIPLDSNGVKAYTLSYPLFISFSKDTYIHSDIFIPNSEYNYIEGESEFELYPNESPIKKYYATNNISPDVNIADLQYKDIKLATIKIPEVIHSNGLDLPFKYDYTIVPCMNYGRLDHLAVSNTVDFSKLHAFNQSTFDIWKYHIDGNQLRLTFGADIYDTYETDKVDGLILEFYDLWGFAGSLEITDKKSYSGIFTKVLSLNTLNTLSKNKIKGSDYIDTYSRNINILENKDASGIGVGTFHLNGSEVVFDFDNGWKYKNTNEYFNQNDNDCGVLYSNVLYGVKAYLRQTVDGIRKFTKKREFFLYTLPIFNDFYYTINDFSAINNPQLELMLTYKIKDKSVKIPYNDNGIVDGYSSSHKSLVDTYLEGFSSETDINVTKYYKYKGTSEVNLEIGLKKEYQDLNLSYSPDINNYFNCNLLLVSDDVKENTFNIKSTTNDSVNKELVLNYTNSETVLDLAINKLGFDSGWNQTKFINTGFQEYNFINNPSNASINVNYEFVVGYPISIYDIVDTKVQATTVCALFHQDDEGNYNYQDFGIKVDTDSNGNPTQYLSNTIFYNGGTSNASVFGVCQQTKTTGNVMDQCISIGSVESDTMDITTPGKLNTGDQLKQMSSHIGRLAFCQPHLHMINEENGVNIWDTTNGLGIAPDTGTRYYRDDMQETDGRETKHPESARGIRPSNALFEKPKYNMVLNTKDSRLTYSKFVSTIEYATTKGDIQGYVANPPGSKSGDVTINTSMRKYKGFTGEQLATFNRKLLETMRNVYAYNPDYNSLSVKLGKVNSESINVTFTSNLVNTKSELNFTSGNTLNNYIYLGPIRFSDYITYLHNYSGNTEETRILINKPATSEVLPQLQFIPGYEYCGTEEAPYLISTLTYNTENPSELESDLEFNSSDALIVRHHDRSINFLRGIPNKRALYGYLESKKLVQLDVSNYSIEANGKLTLRTSSADLTQKFDHSVTLEESKQWQSGYNFNIDYKDADGNLQPLTVNAKLNISGKGQSNILFYGSDSGYNSFIAAIQRTASYDGLTIKPTIQIISTQPGYRYTAKITAITYNIKGKVLNHNLIGYYPNNNSVTYYAFRNQDFDILQGVLDGEYLTLKNSSGNNNAPINTQTLWSNGAGKVYVNNTPDTFGTTYQNDLYLRIPDTGNTNDWDLYEISIENIEFSVDRVAVYDELDKDIIPTLKTRNYWKLEANIYKVIGYTDARILGTSLTLNDLIYEPEESHRLFVQNDAFSSNDIPYRNVIYYRSLTDKSSWIYDNTKNKNKLFLYTGPCFTEENLNGNS